MLEKVELKRFKKFKGNEIQLKPFTVLMGENSSGKTSLLQAVYLSLYTFSNPNNELIRWIKGKPKIRDKGIGQNTLPGIGLQDFRELYYSKISRRGKQTKTEDSTIGATITLFDTEDNKYCLQVSSLFGNYNLKCISKVEDIKAEPELINYKPLYISGFVGLSVEEERSFPMAIQNRMDTGRISTIIRNLILDTHNETPDNYQKLVERMGKDFNFDLSKIVFSEKNDLYIEAKYREPIEKRTVDFDFNSSGSGFMQVLQILVPIYRYCPEKVKIVLLDEPDAHLHPNLQVTLLDSLKDIQEELGIQIILSTHSTSIIRNTSPTQIIPVSSDSQAMTPLVSNDEAEMEITKKIDSYELGKTRISKKILYIEDDQIEIYKRFDRLLGTGIFTGPKTIPVLKGRGKDDKIPFEMKQIFHELFDTKVEVFFLRDRDGLDEDWINKLINYGEKFDVKMKLLNRYEIENYLLIPELIHSVLINKNPGKKVPNEEDIRKKLSHFLGSTINQIKFQYQVNLYDSIWKTGLLIKEANHDLNESMSIAKKITISYDELRDFDSLVQVGMGKETLKLLNSWINDELHLQLNRKSLINNLSASDIPNDIIDFFRKISNLVDE